MVLEEKRGVFEAKGMASCGGWVGNVHAFVTTPCARVGKNEIWVLRTDFRQTALCVMDFKTNTAIM